MHRPPQRQWLDGPLSRRATYCGRCPGGVNMVPAIRRGTRMPRCGRDPRLARVDLGERRARRPEPVDAPGEARVEAEVQHDLLDLRAREAVVQTSGYVECQLALLAERAEQGEHHERAVAARQLGARPDLAEGPPE